MFKINTEGYRTVECLGPYHFSKDEGEKKSHSPTYRYFYVLAFQLIQLSFLLFLTRETSFPSFKELPKTLYTVTYTEYIMVFMTRYHPPCIYSFSTNLR